jgi:hypothetical protein
MAQNRKKVHDAIRARKYSLLGLLIKGGADVDLSYRGKSPLDFAIEYCSSKEMALLIDNGAEKMKYEKQTVLYFLHLFDNHICLLGKFHKVEEHHKLYLHPVQTKGFRLRPATITIGVKLNLSVRKLISATRVLRKRQTANPGGRQRPTSRYL